MDIEQTIFDAIGNSLGELNISDENRTEIADMLERVAKTSYKKAIDDALELKERMPDRPVYVVYAGELQGLKDRIGE